MNGLLVRNANIITMNQKQPHAIAMVVEEDKIISVGDGRNLEHYAAKGLDVLNCRGYTILPGLIDSHLHLMWMGRNLLCPPLNLGGIDSIGKIADIIKDEVEISAPGQWIIAVKLDEDHLVEQRSLNRHDLDKVSPDNPVVVRKAIEHSLVANTAALEKAGINKDTAEPAGGHIEKDSEGSPTGALFENAMKLLEKAIPRLTPLEEREALALAVKQLCSLGFTSVVSNDDFPVLTEPLRLLEDLDALAGEQGWALRLAFEPDISRLDQLIEQREQLKSYRFGKIGPLKIFADGALFTRSAALEEDYADEPGNRGIETISKQELEELVARAHENGFSVAVHAIGDRAVNNAIGAIEKAQQKHPRNDLRHRIIHCSMIDEANLGKMNRFGIIADIQPTFFINEWQWVPQRIGSNRVKKAYLGRSFLDNGVNVIAGSDAPSEPADPFRSIYGAVKRQDVSGKPEGGWKPEERLDVKDILQAYTRAGAYATFEEGLKGSLEPGKLADFIVVNKNPLEINPEELLDIECLMTVIGGKIAWRSEKVS
ncbi:MAG: amidohydrolase [Bacillota bacterium]|nr:amidohydrolase [Bacillota bacterium]